MTLNNHAEDKIKRLLGERFNQETGEVTLVTDRCPMRRQNYDYNMYLLVALYYESMVSFHVLYCLFLSLMISIRESYV